MPFPGEKKKWPKVIAFDTSGPFIKVAWATESYSGGREVPMARGQGEALFPFLEETLEQCGWSWREVDAIGVGVGPGNFTGVRIAVSAARGLGLALKIPVFGLTSFQIAAEHHVLPDDVIATVKAPREMIYVAGPDLTPQLIDPSEPQAFADTKAKRIVGHRAEEIAGALGLEGQDTEQHPEGGVERLADMTEFLYLEAMAFPAAPQPLYIKPADAAPPRDAPPVLID